MSSTSNGKTYKNGLLHSFKGKPAVVTKDTRLWYSNNLLHRYNGPAVVVLLPDGKIIEQWRYKGIVYRAQDPFKPAYIEKDILGRIIYQEWHDSEGNKIQEPKWWERFYFGKTKVNPNMCIILAILARVLSCR